MIIGVKNDMGKIHYPNIETRTEKIVYDSRKDRILTIDDVLKPDYVNSMKQKARGGAISMEMREKAILFEKTEKNKMVLLDAYPYTKKYMDAFTDEFIEMIALIQSSN